MTYPNSGIPVYIPIFIFCLITGIFFCVSVTKPDHEAAIKEFLQWSKQMDIDKKITGYSCVDKDTDNDNYVSCTYVLDGNQYPVECAGAWNFQHGCRIPKLKLNE